MKREAEMTAGGRHRFAKLGIDATVPFEEKGRFARATFKPFEIKDSEWLE